MRRLYIIGNGFDLYHGIPSSYKCFKCYLNRIGCTEQIQILDYLFGENELWSNFEESLGLMSPSQFKKIVDWYQRYDCQRRVPADAALTNAVDLIHYNINNLFKKWIGSLSLNDVTQKVRIYDGDAIFLNFNYTETLEHVYRIPSTKILHIHGTRSTDQLIFGHNLNDQIMKEYAAKLTTDQLRKEYGSLMKDWKKPTENIIANNKQKFFSQLKGISEVFVLGHSLADVDILYFKEIQKNISLDAIWTVSLYDAICPKERLEKEIQLTKIGVNHNLIYYRKLNEL